MTSSLRQSSDPSCEPLPKNCQQTGVELCALSVPFQQSLIRSIGSAGLNRLSPTGGTAYGIPRKAYEESSKTPSTGPHDVTAVMNFPSTSGGDFNAGFPVNENMQMIATNSKNNTTPPIIAKSSALHE